MANGREETIKWLLIWGLHRLGVSPVIVSAERADSQGINYMVGVSYTKSDTKYEGNWCVSTYKSENSQLEREYCIRTAKAIISEIVEVVLNDCYRE